MPGVLPQGVLLARQGVEGGPRLHNPSQETGSGVQRPCRANSLEQCLSFSYERRLSDTVHRLLVGSKGDSGLIRMPAEISRNKNLCAGSGNGWSTGIKLRGGFGMLSPRQLHAPVVTAQASRKVQTNPGTAPYRCCSRGPSRRPVASTSLWGRKGGAPLCTAQTAGQGITAQRADQGALHRSVCFLQWKLAAWQPAGFRARQGFPYLPAASTGKRTAALMRVGGLHQGIPGGDGQHVPRLCSRPVQPERHA